MQANDWWKTVSLFLWLYNTSAMGVVLLYFYGICRLAERNFKGRTYAILLLPFFILMSAGTLAFYIYPSMDNINPWFAIWPWLTCLPLLFVVYRTYRVMLGQ